jgi:hypothetical protein
MSRFDSRAIVLNVERNAAAAAPHWSCNGQYKRHSLYTATPSTQLNSSDTVSNAIML